MLKKIVYLDHAAATPLDDTVFIAMKLYFSDRFYNPSAKYLEATKVSKTIEKERGVIAKWLGAKPTELIFTAGGTEADNLAVHGVMSKYPKANLVVSAIEHEAILSSAKKYNHKLAPVTADGIVDIAKLKELIDDNTVLVSIMYANNEIGSIQPIRKVSKLIKEIRRKRKAKGIKLPIYLHSDACQAPAYLDLHVSGLGVDLMTINAGKIYGPKQCGALYVDKKVNLEPQILGGGQELGRRSGTENVPAIIGFAAALNLVQANRPLEIKRLTKIQKKFINKLVATVPKIRINGSMKNRLPNNVHITIPGKDNETMLMKLSELGIMCASGSACNAKNNNASHTLLAIGLSEEDARSSLRFTMGASTTMADINYTVKAISKII